MWWLVLAACGPVAEDTDITGETGDSDAWVDTAAGDPDADDGDSSPDDTEDGGSDSGSTEVLMEALEVACADLWFMSESDYPLDPIKVEGSFPVTEATIRSAVEPVYTPRVDEPGLEERAVETRDLSWFFDRYTEEQSWWEDAQREAAADWIACEAVFDDIQDPIVFRLGEDDGSGTLTGAIDVFVVGGSASDDLVGLWTISVET